MPRTWPALPWTPAPLARLLPLLLWARWAWPLLLLPYPVWPPPRCAAPAGAARGQGRVLSRNNVWCHREARRRGRHARKQPGEYERPCLPSPSPLPHIALTHRPLCLQYPTLAPTHTLRCCAAASLTEARRLSAAPNMSSSPTAASATGLAAAAFPAAAPAAGRPAAAAAAGAFVTGLAAAAAALFVGAALQGGSDKAALISGGEGAGPWRKRNHAPPQPSAKSQKFDLENMKAGSKANNEESEWVMQNSTGPLPALHVWGRAACSMHGAADSGCRFSCMQLGCNNSSSGQDGGNASCAP